MQIFAYLEWGIWGVLVLFAVLWTVGIILSLITGVHNFQIGTVLTTLSFWPIAAFFWKTPYSKFHILWIVPVSFLLWANVTPWLVIAGLRWITFVVIALFVVVAIGFLVNL